MAIPHSILLCFLFERNEGSRIPKTHIYIYIEGIEEFKVTRYYSTLSKVQTHFSMEKQLLKNAKPEFG